MGPSLGTATLLLGVFTLVLVRPLTQPLLEVQGSLPCLFCHMLCPELGESEHAQMSRAGKD